MPDHSDYLMEPVRRQMCRYESLKDGTLDLEDIAHMNDYIALSADNEAIAQDEAERRRQNNG